MTDKIIAQTELVLVAIGISKARHEVLIAVPGKTPPQIIHFEPTRRFQAFDCVVDQL